MILKLNDLDFEFKEDAVKQNAVETFILIFILVLLFVIYLSFELIKRHQ